MEKTSYESLVKYLFTVDDSGTKVPDVPVGPSRVTSGDAPRESAASDQLKRAPEVAAPAIQTSIPSTEPLPAPVQPRIVRSDPQRLMLTQNEVDDVQTFQLLFQTPRAVKRLANTYSLIRVGVDRKQWPTYLGSKNSAPEYRVPLLLLAVSAAFPSLARPWLLWLRETPPTRWQLEETDVDVLAGRYSDITDRQDWERLRASLNLMELEGWPAPDKQTLAEWVPRVARYSFS